jgi:hypothetical protein
MDREEYNKKEKEEYSLNKETTNTSREERGTGENE